ncbi:SsgA family sporulation/cell division regulator [Actinospica sp. MGRD01-02]|uniref:SsgA family sporulation/cell division regulator n=1 Tax=Actinospica acidithermotolerans TaxID=2828514 RepID=A0A941EE44_9ACTN|nr:SsgA family sporulation/cell division regulator [Actinospica acidithermotolerans]MBR7828983.1 SsgA family sporulation/cell division regulator [Actinospica acidithermotolerans]
MPIITAELNAKVIAGEAGCLDDEVALHYDTADPYAVTLQFLDEDLWGEDSVWWFDREMLAAGVRAPVGEGRLKVWPLGEKAVMLELHTDGLCDLVAVPVEELREFLRLTYVMVPEGAEPEQWDIDQLFQEMTG